MTIKEEFLNLINDINSEATECGYGNAKGWATEAYNQSKLTFAEKEEVFRFIQMRNMMSHGGAERVNIFIEDVKKLKHYKKIMYGMLGIEDPEKHEEPIFVDTQKSKEPIHSNGNEMSLKDFRRGFDLYFRNKKPDYRYPTQLYGMAFYIANNNIGITLEDMCSGRVSLDEYAEIIYNHFYNLKPETAKARLSPYKDAMKNLLEYVQDMHLENVRIVK